MQALRDRVPPGRLSTRVDSGQISSWRPRPSWKALQKPNGLVGTSRSEAQVLRVSEPCERCAFTTLAQGDLPFQREILSGIVQHGGGGFGVLCAIVEGADVTVGDPVRLI
jgi:hypothetical protein